MTSGQIKRDPLSAFHVRELLALHQPEVDRRVEAIWGRILTSPKDKSDLMARLEKTFDEAPLWAFSDEEGRAHFQRLCAACHRLGTDGVRLGPELTGAGKHGVRYFLENIIDPNAVIGLDFQLTTIETKSGEVVSGLVSQETPTAVVLRTATDTVTVPKADITKREITERSLMPEGLLESLGERESIELLKYLTSN